MKTLSELINSLNLSNQTPVDAPKQKTIGDLIKEQNIKSDENQQQKDFFIRMKEESEREIEYLKSIESDDEDAFLDAYENIEYAENKLAELN